MTSAQKTPADEFFTYQQRNFTERDQPDQVQLLNMIPSTDTTHEATQG